MVGSKGRARTPPGLLSPGPSLAFLVDFLPGAFFTAAAAFVAALSQAVLKIGSKSLYRLTKILHISKGDEST